MIEQPIKIGDVIAIKGVVGKVTSIGIRCIIIRTSANNDVLIPKNYNFSLDHLLEYK